MGTFKHSAAFKKISGSGLPFNTSSRLMIVVKVSVRFAKARHSLALIALLLVAKQ